MSEIKTSVEGLEHKNEKISSKVEHKKKIHF